MDYEIKPPAHSKCLECGDTIEYGRQDKKFCSSDCKNKYHNRRIRGSHRFRMRILTTLDRNYSILENLLKAKVTSLSLTELQNLGFKLECVTSYRKVRRHDVFLCFDIAFTVISDRVISISRLADNLSLASPDTDAPEGLLPYKTLKSRAAKPRSPD